MVKFSLNPFSYQYDAKKWGAKSLIISSDASTGFHKTETYIFFYQILKSQKESEKEKNESLCR